MTNAKCSTIHVCIKLVQISPTFFLCYFVPRPELDLIVIFIFILQVSTADLIVGCYVSMIVTLSWKLCVMQDFEPCVSVYTRQRCVKNKTKGYEHESTYDILGVQFKLMSLNEYDTRQILLAKILKRKPRAMT